MRSSRWVFAAVLGLGVSTLMEPAQAQPRLGKPSVGGDVEMLLPADSVYDNLSGVRANGNLPLCPHLDLSLSAGSLWGSGTDDFGTDFDTSSVGAGVRGVFFNRFEQSFAPYASFGFSMNRQDVDASFHGSKLYSDEKSLLGIGAGLGAEIEGGPMLYRCGLDFNYADNETSINLVTGAGLWIGKKNLVRIYGTYSLDEKDAALGMGYIRIL